MRIYAAKVIGIQEADRENLCRLLDQNRQKKVSELKAPEEKERSVTAGLLLRYAFLQNGYDAKARQQVKTEQGEYGKPVIKGYSDFCYSLSHSGEWCVCAAAEDPVGVDIQEMRDWKPRFAERFFHKDEYNRLLSIKEADINKRTVEFYSLWTAKESMVKLSGRGIGGGISQYLTDTDYTCIWDCSIKKARLFNIKLYNGLSGYMVCACSKTGGFPIKLEIIDFSNLDGQMEGNIC